MLSMTNNNIFFFQKLLLWTFLSPSYTIFFDTRVSLLRKQLGASLKHKEISNCSMTKKIVMLEATAMTCWSCPCGLISVTLNWSWCHILKWVNILGFLKKRCKYALYGLSSLLNASLPVGGFPIYSPHFLIKQKYPSVKWSLNAVSGNLLSSHREFDKLSGYTLPLSKSILRLSSINKLVENLSVSSPNVEGNVSHEHFWRCIILLGKIENHLYDKIFLFLLFWGKYYNSIYWVLWVILYEWHLLCAFSHLIAHSSAIRFYIIIFTYRWGTWGSQRLNNTCGKSGRWDPIQCRFQFSRRRVEPESLCF